MKLLASLCFTTFSVALGTFKIARHVDALVFPSTTLNITGTGPSSSPCAKSDKYGSDACTLHWNETYQLHLKGTMPPMSRITPLDFLKVVGTFFGALPFEWECHACGKPCEMELPPPWRTNISFAVPDCPIYESTFDHVFNLTMPASAPVTDLLFRGFISIDDSIDVKAKVEVEIEVGKK